MFYELSRYLYHKGLALLVLIAIYLISNQLTVLAPPVLIAIWADSVSLICNIKAAMKWICHTAPREQQP